MKNYKVTSLTLGNEDIEKLVEFSSVHGLSRSAIIRLALRAFLSKQKGADVMTTEQRDLTCTQCHETGPGVHQVHEYLGGHGMVWFVECSNRKACMRRQEEQNAG